MNIPALHQNQTMSSREIAELTKKEHSKVVADIERILKEVGIDAAGFRVIYTDSMNREQLSYSLPKRECDLVISGYVAKYRLAIIDRWQELESQQVPKTLSSALRLAADQAEQIELLQLQAQKDAPKVEFAMAVRNMQGACKLGDFGKVIGVGRNTLFQWLRRDEYLMGDNMPYQKHIDSGLFVVIEQTPYVDRDGKAHPTFTTILTGKGQVVIEKKYRKD